MAQVIFLVLILFYILAFSGYLMSFYGKEFKRVKPDLFFELAFLLHTFFIFVEARESHVFLPLTTLKEVLIFFTWALSFVYSVLLRRVKHEMFGLVLLPFLICFLAISSVMTEGKAIPIHYFENYHFLLHILTAFFAYASFTLSFVAAALYLVQSHTLKSKQIGNLYQKLPSLKELEQFIFYSVIWGVFLLGVAIASGLFWSKSMFNTYVVREPKSISSIVTWIVYMSIVFLRNKSKISERRSVRFVFLAFALVLFTFIGTSLFQTKLHVGM